MRKYFGTDGIRRIANTELSPELVYKVAKAGAYVLSKHTDHTPTILIGRDTRISGCMLEDALCAGILSMGGDVIKVGVIPTPGIAFLVRKLNAAAGVVISASHNPFEYNGIKFFRGDGYKLDDAIEDEIEKYVKEGVPSEAGRSGADLGRIIEPEESPVALYREFVKSTFDGDLKGIKLVLDCANGASYVAAEDVFTELGADVKVIADKPDGININDKCGSTHPEALGEAVLREHADMGLAFDGDADRLIAVDETGNAVDGDRVISVCARLMKDEGRLANDSVTVTVMSNIGFHKRAEELGIKVEVTAVGDRYVLENMKKTGCRIGGEQSGHMIFLDYSTTGDGMIAALQLLKAYKRYGKKLSELAEEMTVYPQVLINAHVKNENKHNYMENADVKAAIEEVEKKMAGEGRVLIRPSGTEPLVRVMLEGSDTEKIRPLARGLADLIESKLS